MLYSQLTGLSILYLRMYLINVVHKDNFYSVHFLFEVRFQGYEKHFSL